MQEFFDNIIEWFDKETKILEIGNYPNWIWLIIFSVLAIIIVLIIIFIVLISKNKKKINDLKNSGKVIDKPVVHLDKKKKVDKSTNVSDENVAKDDAFLDKNINSSNNNYEIMSKNEHKFSDKNYTLESSEGRKIFIQDRSVWLVEKDGFAKALIATDKLRPTKQETILYQISAQKITTVTFDDLNNSSKKVEDSLVTGVLITFVSPSIAKIGDEVFTR